MARTGRRPGNSGTRESILAAARQRFADDGFRAATVRGIAADAGVDPALIHHYFGTKRQLFATVLDLPVGPDTVIRTFTGADPDAVGERIVRTFLEVWEEPPMQDRMRMLLRTAVTDDRAAGMIRDLLMHALLEPIARQLGVDEPRLRATYVASQLIGFALLRYVLRIEPLASATREQIVAGYAPTVQRYLTEPL